MYDSNLENFLILRELDEPATVEDPKAVDVRSTEVRHELRDDGIEIWAIQSEVKENGEVTGTHCHYQAESEAAIREHASRAELPVTRLHRRGQPVAGDKD